LFKFLVSITACLLGLTAQAGNLWPPRSYDPGVVAEWNSLLVAAAPSTAGTDMPRYYAMMHMAIFDAVNAIEGGSRAFHARVHAPLHASSDAAAAQAAHDVLVALLPGKKAEFDFALTNRLRTINPDRAQLGAQVGREVAAQILKWRAPERTALVVPARLG
jgi:hypothetical protein